MQIVSISGSPRTDLGKKHNKQLRKAGAVPCVIYGGESPIHFSAPAGVFRPLIYTPDFKLVEIEVEGKTYKCIMKDTQFHPVTDALMHVDLLELVANKKVNVELPVKFVGVSPGVKNGGKLIQNLRRIKVKTTPEKLIDHLTLDISDLALGSAIRIRDITAVDGIEVINSPAIPVATVEVPRALKSAEAGAEGEAAEGEIATAAVAEAPAE